LFYSLQLHRGHQVVKIKSDTHCDTCLEATNLVPSKSTRKPRGDKPANAMLGCAPVGTQSNDTNESALVGCQAPSGAKHMQILLINNNGGGFADYIDVREGTSITELFQQRIKGRPADFLIRVNRQPVAATRDVESLGPRARAGFIGIAVLRRRKSRCAPDGDFGTNAPNCRENLTKEISLGDA
jgi:hypothetical protein